MSAKRRLVAVVLAGLVPWVVMRSAGETGFVSFVLSFGLANPGTLHVTTLPAYLFVHTQGLPASLQAWPVATLLWLLAATNAGVGVAFDREDRRLTGGLLVLAGGSLLPLALVVGRPDSVLAFPLGTVVLWSVAWWGYRGSLRRIVTGEPAPER